MEFEEVKSELREIISKIDINQALDISLARNAMQWALWYFDKYGEPVGVCEECGGGL